MAIKVLIVDDAMFMRNMIAEIFNGKKYGDEEFEVVAEAENGLEAVEKYREHKPDIVTVSFGINDTGGREPEKFGESVKKIVKTLKDTGYDGALTVEFVAPVDRTPATKYPNAVEQNPVNISREQLKFIQDHGSGD